MVKVTERSRSQNEQLKVKEKGLGFVTWLLGWTGGCRRGHLIPGFSPFCTHWNSGCPVTLYSKGSNSEGSERPQYLSIQFYKDLKVDSLESRWRSWPREEWAECLSAA